MTNFPAIHYPELPPFYVCRSGKKRTWFTQRQNSAGRPYLDGSEVPSTLLCGSWAAGWLFDEGAELKRREGGREVGREGEGEEKHNQSCRVRQSICKHQHPQQIEPPTAPLRQKKKKGKQPAVRRPCSWTHILHRAAFSAGSLCRVTHRSPSSQSALLLFKTRDKWGFLKSVLAAGLHWVKTLHGTKVSSKLFVMRQVFLRCLGKSEMKQKEKDFLSSSSHFSTCGCEAGVFIISPSSSWCQVAFVSFY